MSVTFDPENKTYSDGITTLALSNGVYEIDTIEELKLFRDAVNAGNNFNGQTVRLMKSIDLNNEEWTPIGTSSATAFRGTFDGNGQTISNLKITKGLANTAANNNVGFFGYTNSPAKITDLTIENVDITGSLYVGAIVGYGFRGAEISNCRVTGQIEIEGWWYIGGIGGNGYVSKVDNCTVTGDEGSYIKALNSGSYVGGIWGFRGEGNMVISDCTVDNIDITGYDRTGGICGIAHYGNTIEGCTITNSSITADSNAGNIGLIAGANLGDTTNGPAILLNNTADVETKEHFTLEGQVPENPPMLGENDHMGDPGKAAIVGDVTLNEAGEITGGTITVVGTEKDNVDVNSKLDFVEGFQAYPTGDGTLEVDETGYVASVNGTRYKSLSEAITAAGAGGTVTLVDNVTLDSKLTLTQNQLFDLNGFTLDGAISLTGDADVTFQNGTMTAAYNSTTSNAYSVVTVNDTSVLTLDGVTLTPADSLNRGQATHAVVYQSTGALNIVNSTVSGGNLVHDEKYTSGTNTAANAIYAYGASGGIIRIEGSTITGGVGKTDAVYDGSDKSGLYVEGGEGVKLGGTAAVSIVNSTVHGGDSDWYNAGDAIDVTNTFKGTLTISDSSKISGGDSLDLSGETSRGIGGCAIYTNQSTGCTQIVVTDSELTGGDGGHSWNGSALELNTGVPEVTITNSTLTVGQGENSKGNAGAIRVNNTNTIYVNLDGVTLNGDGDANHVFQITSNVTNGGISLAGETTISGGTLENVEFVEVAEGTTIKTTGTGAVDAATVTNPTLAPVYDETTGGYVFETLETSTDTLFVDDDWANLAEGTVVQVDGKNYRIGMNAFGSIQAAVNAAADGATVNVAAGSYAEDVTISKGITINGAEGHASAVTSFGIGADNVTIDGFAIAPANQNCYGSSEMPLAAGVYLTAGGATDPLQNISVVNNTIDCSGVMADGVKATGVAFGTGSSSYFSTNVMVMNNTITGGGSSTAQNGLYLRFVDGAVVSGNTITGFAHHLAQFETGGNYTVTDNVLSDTNRNGLQFGGVTSGTNEVSGNKISDCRGTSKDDGALVLRNDGAEGTMSVTGNTITGNNTGVYISEVTNVDNLTITGNVIDQNTIDIVSNSDSNIMLAGNNYGPDGALTKTYGNGALNVGESTDPVAGVALILVNAEYAGHNTILGPDGNFYTVGENAFANMKDAAPAITAETLEVRVTGKVSWPGNQTVDMSAATGKNTITFNDITDGSVIGAYRTYIKGNRSTVVVFNNVNASSDIFLSNLGEVSIVGNSTVDLTAYNNLDSNHTKTFTNVGKLTVTEGSTCHFANANQFGLGNTVISGAGTIKSSGTLIVSGDNSQFTGVLEIANGVVMESVQSGFANASQIINNGTMQCNAAGKFTYNQTIVGNGMIKAWVQNAGTEVVLTGDISGYTGQFDVVSGNTIKLNTTLNDTVNLAHSGGAAGTIELNGKGTAKDIIINSTTTTTTGLKVFANWNNVTIQSNGNETSTVLGTIYFGGNGNAAAAKDFDMTLSAINTTGGKSIGNLYFGGIGNTVKDGADEDANALHVVVDTVYGSLVGGGQQSTITGDITFDVVNGASGAEIVGAGEGNTVNGNISIKVNSADDTSVGNITGGRAVHEVSGDIAIAIADGKVGNVYGLNSGDANGTSVGNIQIDVTGGTVSTIRGGNSSSGKVPGTFEAESVKINLTGGEVTGKIYGGSQLAADSIAVVVDGGQAADIYAGSKYAAVGTASIEVKNGTVGRIYGGGAGGTDDIGYSTVKTSAIRVSGGTVNGEIYGGGTEGDVTTSATVTITGGTITNDIYGGGYGEATVKTAEVVVSGEDVTFAKDTLIRIYGGGNGTGDGQYGSTSVVDSASVKLTGIDQGESMLYVYGGGAYGTQKVAEGKVEITDSSVYAVYGGTAGGWGSVDKVEIVLNGATVSNEVYGGSATATAAVGGATITLTGGTVVGSSFGGGVYGGGFSGGVTGNVAIHISGATVNGDVNLGAWSGDATVGGSATLTISGGNNTLEGVTANGIAGGATIDVKDGTQIAGVTSDGALTLTGNGVYTSGITAEKLTAETLAFEVTKEELASGTLINLTGSDSSAVGTVTVKVTDGDLSSFNGATLISGDPGQGFNLTLTDGTSSATIETAADTVLANSNWADYAAGSVVLYNGKFYQIGTNAFGSITDAAATDVSTKILVVDGTWNGDQYFNGHVVEIGTADTAVTFDNYVFGGALNEITGDINLDYVNGDVSRIYGAAVNAEGDYTAGNITLNIGEDVTVSGRMAAGKVDAGNLTTGDVEINYAGNSAGSGVALFGGAQAWDVGSTATHESVTLNISGELTDVVYAAGQAMHGGWVTVKNGVTTNVTGGSIGTDGLMGGGFSRSDTSETDTAGGITIEGGTWINISGGEITDVYGGTHTYSDFGQLKPVSTITGGTHINMTGGTVGNVRGGGYAAWGSEATIDSTEVKVSGGTVLGDVQGGSYVVGGGKDKDSGNSSTITGDVSVVISGDADIQGNVFGGSWVNWSTGTAASYIEGVSKVVVEGGQITGNVAGGGVTYAHENDNPGSKLISESGSTEVTLTGGTIKGSVIGGGVAIDDYNKGATLTNSVSNTSVVIDGATVEGSVIAGGYAEGVNTTTSVTGGVAVEIKSGTIMEDVYGGSIAGNIGGDSTISISGGDILGGVYGADETGTTTGNSTLSFDNAGDYTTSITVISGFDDVSFNGGTVNFTNVTFQDTVISVSDAAPVQGETYTFATGAMSFGDGTQFRFGDALYTLGVAGENGFVFDYNAETGLVADLANLDTTTFAVNSGWSTLADRTVVELNGDSYTVGINAFGTFADAISGFGTNATANQATSQIIFGSDNTSGVSGTKYYLYTDTDLALTTDGTPRTVTINGDRLYLMNVYALDSEFKPIPNDDLPTVTIGEGLTLVTGGLLNVGQNVDQTDVADGKPTRDPAAMKLMVDGTLVTRLYVASNSEVVVSETGRILMGAKESFITRTGAQMTVNGDGTKDEVQFEVNYTSMQGGVLTLKDTWMKSGVVWLNTSDQGFDNEPSTLILNNSKLEGSQGSGIQSGSTITASNGSEMTFVGVVENAGTISLDASSLSAKGGVVNSGTMNFTDAVDANTIANSGTMNFSGKSSFSGNAEGIDNSALIQIIDGTLTLDGGSFSNRGNIHVGDFADNTAAGSLKIVNGASVTTAGTIYIGTGTETFGANTSILELDSTAGEFKINNGIYIREDGKMLVNGHSGASFSNVNVGGEFEMIGANSVSTGISVGRNTANGGPAVFHMKDSTLTDNAALTFGYKLNRDAEVTLENSHIIENSTQEVAFGVGASGGYGIATVTMTGSSLKTPGAVSIGEGSSVTLQEASSLDAPEITNNGTLSFSGSSLTATKGTVINNGVLNAADSSLKITRSSNTGGALINNSGAELVLDNTAVFRSGSAATKYYGVWTLDNAGTIKLTNGSYLGAYTLTNSGSITLDYTSTLGLTNYSGAGSVTVDTTGYTGGAYKLFNDEQYTGTWTVEDYQTLLGEGNWRDDYYVIGGDLILTDADMTNFYVNTAWSDLEEYDAIEGHDKVYYGLNAYDIGSNAILNAINSGSDVTVHLESDAGVVSGGHLGVVWRLNNNTTTITADEARTLTLPIGQVTASGFYLEGNGNLVFDKNVTVHWTRKDGVGDQSLYFGSVAGSDTLPVMEVKGAMIVDQSFNIGEYQVDGKSDAAGELIIHEGASLSVGEQFVMRGNGAALDLKDGATASFNYATIYGGELNATGATLESKAFVSISWLPRSNGESYGTTFAMNLTDSTFTVGTNFSVTGGDSAYQAEVTLDGSELIVNGEFSSDRTVSLTNGSTLELKGLATNGGILNVNDSALNATELASTGEINVSGISTLNIGTLTGEVDLLDGAVLTDSTVGGKVVTEGDVTVTGTTTLGQLVLEGARGDDRTIVIDENANVSLGHLDVGSGLPTELVPGDKAERAYYGHVLVKGALSVDKADQSGAIYIRPYAELVVTGTLDVKGEVHNRGSLVVDGGAMTMSAWETPKLLGYTTGDRLTVTNSGTMTVLDADAVTFGEASASLQHMEVEAQYADGMFATISDGGRFEADTLAFANDDDVTLKVTGKGSSFKLYTDGRDVYGGYSYVQNEGRIIVDDQAVFDVSELANGNFVNSGSIEITNASATFATLTNDGTVTIGGTSAIAAQVDGDLDIVDGADVTFGAGSTADDLRIASGAEVTLRGGLSSGNIYGADENGTHEYNDVSNGITVNVVTGDGETFKSYAWYASNGSTYNVTAGSNVELTYANINATGTVNVAEGATLTTVQESSNIVGTLNVDGTVNSVMTVYAGLADGNAAGLVNVSETGTVNSTIMAIGTAVRDDAKYNAAGTNTTATVAVDGGTLNATGQEGELTSKLLVGSDDFAGMLTGTNGATINVGERTAKGTGYMRFVIGKQGTLSLADSTLAVYNLGGTNNSDKGIFENNGTISMDLDSLITTATVLNNLGTITVDMDGAAEFGIYKLIDYTGAGNVTGYGNVTLSNNAYETVVVDGDLYAANVDMTTLKVNASWSGRTFGDEVETGFFYGANAFDNLNTAIAGMADDTVTISIAAGNYGETSAAQFTDGVAIVADNAVFTNTWSFGINSDTAASFDMETAEKFTVSGTLKVGSFYAEKNANVYVVVDGDLTTVGSFGAKLATQVDVNGTVTVTPPSNGASQVLVYGTMNVTGKLDSTSGSMGAVMLIGLDRYDEEYGKGGVLNVTGADASVTLRGNTGTDMPVTISGLSSLNISDGGSFTHEDGSLENKGTVNVDNGTLNIAGTVENSGAVNFSNATDANTIANSGTVNFKGGTEFQGEITGNGTVQYMGADNKLTGDVSAQKFIVGLEGAEIATDLEISGGATVNVTGGGNSGRIGVNTDVVITGKGTTFTTANNVTMDESATLEISDRAVVSMGYLATGGKTDVTNAVLNLTAASSSIGGLGDSTVFNVNEGGKVNAEAGLYIGHRDTKNGLVNVNKGGKLNVSGGALYVSALYPGYTVQGNGTLNVDGGTVTADNGGDHGLIVGDDWDGASGILNVTNGGSIDAGYSIQLNSTSQVMIDGGSMSAEQMYQSEGGELSIVNGGNVTLTNAYFAMGGKITVGGNESGKTSVLETLAGAEKRPASLGGDYTGHDGETVLNIEKNGEVILGTGLIVGHRAEENVSKDATVNVNEGGKLQVADSLQLGSTGEYQAQGVVNVNGGELDASAADVTINNRGELNVNGGSFSAQSVTNNGAVVITGTSTVDTKFAAAGTGSVEIVDATLGVGTSINEVDKAEAQTYYNNIALKGTVTITDGYLNSGWNGNLAMGFSTGMSSGELNIANGAVVSVGGSLYFGTEEADGNFQLNVSGEGTSLQSNGNNGEFYIFSDAVVSVTNGASMMNNARIRSGATYVFGAVDDTVAATVQFRSFELVEGANVTIQGGATADLGILVFGDSYMDYDGSFTLAAGSLLKLSSYSSERNAAEITVSGIDDTFSGVRKLIDNTGSTVLDYSDMIANWGDINTSVKVVENDLYQVNVDMTTLLVDSGWSDLSVATEVKDGFFYRFNAFDNMSEAIAVSADDTTINVASGTYAENVVVTGNRALELGAVKMNNLMLGSKDEAFTGTFDLESLLAVGKTSSISDGALILRNGEFTMTDFTADVIALGNNNFDTSDEDAVAGTTYRISSGEVVVNNLFYVGCADAEKTDRRNAYTLTVDGEGQLKIEHGTLNIRQDGVFNVNGANTDVNLSQFLVYGEANITDGAEVSAFNLQVYNDDDKAQLRVTDSTIKMQIDNLGGTVYIGDRNGSRSGSVSLENSALDANNLLLGSKTVGAGKSSLSLTGGSKLSVDKTFSITAGGVLTIAGASSVTANKDITNAGTITQDATSTLKVSGDFVNTGDARFDGTTTIVGNYDSDTLTLNAGAVFSAGSITVDALTMALGSSLELTGTGSVIDSFTVTGDTVVDMEYQLVVSGWDISYAGGKVFYQGDSYTVTADTGSLNGINFVLGDDGNLYVKNFGATPEQVFIGEFDSTWSGEVGSRTKVIDGVTYVEGYTAFESMADAMARYPEIGTTVTSVILVNENVVDGFLYDDTNKVEMITVSALTGADEQNPTVSTIADGVTINGDLKLVIDEAAALTGGSINVVGGTTVENHGHLDTTLVSDGALSLTNTSDYTLSGEYTAPSIELNNSGTAVDLTLNATTGDITIDNSGTMTDTVLNAFNAVVLSGEGEYEDVTVNSELLYLNGIDFTFTDGEVTTVYLNDQWMSIPGGKLTLQGGTVGKVDGLYFGTTMSSGTVVIDGVELAAITLSNIGRLQLASGESRFGGSEVATYSVEELEISAGASLNWSWTSDDANQYNIDIQSWSDDNRIKAVDADGTFAFTQVGEYAMENFDVSEFAGLVNVSGNSILNLEDEAGYFADGAAVTLESGAKLNLNGYGTDEVETGMNFLGDGEVAVNFDHSLTGDLSGFNGFYTLGSGVTATFEEVATLAGEMTLHGEGTANFANRTEPAAVRITSDELATNLVLNNNDATLVGGSYGTITTSADDGSISIIAGININAEAVDVNAVNISIDSALDYTGPALTVSGLANNFGTITVTSDTAEFKSPYTLIATDDGIGFGSEIAFTVGTDSVALTIGGTAVRFNNFWIQAYVEDGDLKIANVPGDSGDILVNSDWPTTAGAQVDWLGVEHIIDRDASKTVDRAFEIVAPKSTGEASTITIVKADTYRVSNVAMTAENGVSKLVVSADSLDAANPLQPGDVNLLGEVIATDGTAAGTSLTLKNVGVRGNLFGGAENAALAGDAALTIESAFGNKFTGFVFGGSHVTTGSVDDSGRSSSLTIDGGAYSGGYLAGGAYAQGGSIVMDSSSLTVTNSADTKLLANGRLVGGGVAQGAGASITQQSASITIDSSNADAEMLYLRGDIYAGGIQLSGGSVSVNETSVTFTGLGEKLSFTSRVSGGVYGQAVGTFAGESTLVFDDFTGEFQGLIQDFGTMKFTGDSVVTFSRKQTLSSEMNLEFSIEGRTNTTDAMFTVNQYGWVYGDTITITTGDFTTGSYVLADGYDFSGLNFVIDGAAYTLGTAYTDAAGNTYTVTAADNKLLLDYINPTMITIEDAAGELDLSGRTSMKVTGTASDMTFLNTDSLTNLSVEEGASLSLASTLDFTNAASVVNDGSIVGPGNTGAIFSGAAPITIVNNGEISAIPGSMYNRAIFTEGRDARLDLTNTGTINGAIYCNISSIISSDMNMKINNTGTITAQAISSTSSAVEVGGPLTITGDNGLIEIVGAGTAVDGYNGIDVAGNGMTIQSTIAGDFISKSNIECCAIWQNNGNNIEISGNDNLILAKGTSSSRSYGIYEYSLSTAKVVISGDNNTIVADTTTLGKTGSSASAYGILARSQSVEITGSGTEVIVNAGDYNIGYAMGIVGGGEYGWYEDGNVTVGVFDADGNVTEWNDLKVTVNGTAKTHRGVYTKLGTAAIALDTEGSISAVTAIEAGNIQLSSKGTISGNILSVGNDSDKVTLLDGGSITGDVDLGAGDDLFAMDIDSLLDGTLSNAEIVDITGFDNLAGTSGSVGLIAGIGSMTDGFQLDGFEAELGVAQQVSDTLWAKLSNDDGSLVVSWGESEKSVSAAFDAFNNNTTLDFGAAMVSTDGTSFSDLSREEFSDKKSKGTLA